MSPQYAHPEVLVDTAWVEAHRQDPSVRIVESDEDVLLYTQGHVPGAVKIDWHTDLQDAVRRDYIDSAAFARLCSSKGIGPDTVVVFYGDKSNWWACYAFWTFKLYGHAECRIMNGGRKKWELDGREWSRDPEPPIRQPNIPGREPDHSVRAFRDEVLATAAPAGRWSTSVRRANTPARCCTCPTIHRRGPSVADTFPVLSAFPGRGR